METKICAKCKIPKELSHFNKDKNKKDGLNYWCKDCNKINLQNYYSKNKEKVSKDNYKNKVRYRKEKKDALRDYLLENPCVDCGNSDIRVLEFDHVRGIKKMDVTKMVSHAYSWEKIQEEIDKCEVVCANCHKIRTFGRLETCYRNPMVQRKEEK